MVLGEVDCSEAGLCALLELAVEVSPVATRELDVLVIHLGRIVVEIKKIAVAIEFAIFEAAKVPDHASWIVKSALALRKAGEGKLSFVNISIGQY